MTTFTVVGSLMSHPVATCGKETSLRELIGVLAESRVSCIVVCEDDKPVGILTERDVVGLFNNLLEGDSALAQARVAELMTPSPLTVTETTPLFDALVVTQTSGFRHLPVINSRDKLVGILTYSDLAKAYEQIVRMQSQVLEEEIGNKTRHLKEINEHLVNLSMQDPLLEIGNRRAMEVDLNCTHQKAIRNKNDYAIVLFDVDHFKAFNDFYGHQAGDQALKLVVSSMKNGLRSSDRLYRFGGEEILLLMEGASLELAIEIANRCVQSLNEMEFEHRKSPLGTLTISGGIASLGANYKSKWKDVVERADEGLYLAKNAGRNQVCFGKTERSTEKL